MIRHALILVALFTGYYFLVRDTAYFGPFVYDEADYMHAVRFGAWSNWTDSPSIPLPDLVRIGLTRGRDRGNQSELSAMIRQSNDVLFYRHWHGPLYVGWLAISRAITSDERSIRGLTAIFPIATALLTYFGSRWMLAGAAGEIAGTLGAFLFLWHFAIVRSLELAPHQWFAGSVIAALLFLMKIWRDPLRSRVWWAGALIMSAVAFCLLEVAFALILTLMVCAWMLRAPLKLDLRFAAMSAAIFLGTVLILWPAAVLKFAFVKSYLFMAYLAVFRRGAWGNNVSIPETWWLRIETAPVLWILFAGSVILYFRDRKKLAFLAPPLVFSAFMFLAIFRVNTDLYRYVIPLLPGIVLAPAFGFATIASAWTGKVRAGSVAAICALIFITTWPFARSAMPAPNWHAGGAIALIREHAAAGKPLLVPHSDLPMLHYYFPGLRFETYYDEPAMRRILDSGTVAGAISEGDSPRFTAAN